MKIIKIFIFILSILFIKSVLKSEVPIELNLNTDEPFTITESTKYKIDTSQIINEKYVHLEIIGSAKDTNYVLSIVDDFDQLNRIQLGQSVLGNTDLILSKDQIKDNSINMILECSDYLKCSGTIKNEFLTIIPLTENKPYNYYNPIDNMLMEFNLKSDSELLNIWARGELEIVTNLEGVKFIKYKDTNFYIVNNTNSNEITFKVTGKKGDYINVGYTGYNKINSYDKNEYILTSELKKDGYILSAYIDSKLADEFCYNYENTHESNEGIFASGIIYTKQLDMIKSSKSEHGESQSVTTYDGENFNEDELEGFQTLCLSMSRNRNESLYTLQIYSNKSLERSLNIFEPQYNGIFYSYKLKPSKKVAIISKSSNNFENIIYILQSSGPTKLYVMECNNYPLCSLDDSSFNESLSAIRIGRISSINLKKEQNFDFSPINNNQKIYVAKCEEYAKEDCEIISLINRNDKEINLGMYVALGRNTFKDQIDKYKINYLSFYNLGDEYTFLVEINILAGEVDILVNFPEEVEYKKSINLNKISLTIKMKNQDLYHSLIFSIKSLDNSFYVINLLPKLGVDGKFYNDIYLIQGFPRLYSFSKEEMNRTNVLIMNENRSMNISKTISFNSLNCEVNINQIADDEEQTIIPLKKLGHFFHSSPEFIDYEIDMYEVKLINDDISDYNDKKCLIYLSYIDKVVEKTEDNYVDILIPDNTPQQIMFNDKLKKVSYGYYHNKWENDIIIKYSSKNKAKYIAKIYYSNQKREKEDSVIMGDGIIYLNYEEWENICKDKDCYIKMDITLEKVNFEEEPEPILEITIKSLQEKMVDYIPKGEIIKDYIHYQKSQYYYTELGKNEIGYVNIHFLKGSGKIVAKIVEEDKTELNPDWKGKYVLPTKDNADLKMDNFSKKLYFSTEKYNCENKCYLIINVFSDIKDDKLPMKRIYPYRINVQSYPNNYNNTELPIILAPVDEYIIGSLEKGKEKDVYEFYQIQLNTDADNIVIDIHSRIEKILINIGNKRPTIYNNNFKFDLKKDEHDQVNLFILTKNDLKKEIKDSDKINLKDLLLTISLYSSNSNANINNIPYSFIIRLSNEKEKDIYRINSETQILRKSRQSSGQSISNLFLIEYDYISDFSFIMIYAKDPENPKNTVEIKAKYVDYEDYLFGKLDYSNFNYSNSGKKYLYLQNGFMQNDKPKTILVSVGMTNEKIFKFFTSFDTYTNFGSIYIEPSYSSIQNVPNGESFSLFISNFTQYYITFRHLDGKGEIYYKNSEHYVLNESQSYLTLNFSNQSIEVMEIITKAVSGENNNNDNIGFLFYLEHNLGNPSPDKEEKGKPSSPEDKGMDTTTLVVIIISCILGVVVIVLVVVVCIFYRKNKNLNRDIYKVSFEKGRENNDNNLLLNDDN